jgi:hypothetical protein
VFHRVLPAQKRGTSAPRWAVSTPNRSRADTTLVDKPQIHNANP